MSLFFIITPPRRSAIHLHKLASRNMIDFPLSRVSQILCAFSSGSMSRKYNCFYYKFKTPLCLQIVVFILAYTLHPCYSYYPSVEPHMFSLVSLLHQCGHCPVLTGIEED